MYKKDQRIPLSNPSSSFHLNPPSASFFYIPSVSLRMPAAVHLIYILYNHLCCPSQVNVIYITPLPSLPFQPMGKPFPFTSYHPPKKKRRLTLTRQRRSITKTPDFSFFFLGNRWAGFGLSLRVPAQTLILWHYTIWPLMTKPWMNCRALKPKVNCFVE